MTFNTVAPSTKQIVRFALVLAIGLAAIAGAKAGQIKYTEQQRAACTPDAFRLCMSEIPNVSAVRSCMLANKSKLSAACRATFAS
jgi:hypothetical protein